MDPLSLREAFLDRSHYQYPIRDSSSPIDYPSNRPRAPMIDAQSKNHGHNPVQSGGRKSTASIPMESQALHGPSYGSSHSRAFPHPLAHSIISIPRSWQAAAS
ncbi:hypothetical protein KM043_002354 [Ampulex compressa]|nr:hypothetical protein KM043_002354 [Ampulex compressa]